jgi:TolB protein
VCTGDVAFDLWLYDLTGAVTQLTDLPGAEAFPDWSPDGGRVAFVGSQEGNCDVYAIGPDGAGLSNLTGSEADEMYPSWSPDGREIVYSSGGQLHVIDVASGEHRQLTDSELIHDFPDWSPDGGSIIFSGGIEPAGPGAIHDIYLVPVWGGEEVALSDEGRLLVAPRWSPDGRLIAYFDHTDTLTVWTMSADGSDRSMVGPGGHLSWGPDGASLVYDLEVADGDVDLYVAELAEPAGMLVVDGPGIDTTPAWSPDGEMIVFASDRSQ